MSETARILRTAHANGIGPAVYEGVGISESLPEMIRVHPKHVLLVASRDAVQRSRLAGELVRMGATHFSRVKPNPTTALAMELSGVVKDCGPRAIVAIGGGSTIDLAKAGRVLRPGPSGFRALLAGNGAGTRARTAALYAVPTTAGSGSEMTPFATLYHHGRKISLDFPGCSATAAVLDGHLSQAAPPRVAIPALADALCHAIESRWSLASTGHSAPLADHAVQVLARLAAHDCIEPPLTVAAAHERLLAAALAGSAIAITRTTAAHGFSYYLTARQAVPHGLACAINLSWLARYNWSKRGCGGPHLTRLLTRLGASPDAAHDAPIPRVMELVRLAARLGVLQPIRLSAANRHDYLVEGFRHASRTENNPVPLTPRAVWPYLRNMAADGDGAADSMHRQAINE